MQIRFLIPVVFVAMLAMNSCYYDKTDKLYPSTTCDTAKMSFNANIKSMMKTNCTDKGCHTSSNPNGSIELETFAGTKATVAGDKLMNALNYVSGGSKNMPPTGKISDCDLSKVQAWIKRGSPEN